MCYQCRRNSPELLTLEKERKLSCRLCKAFPGIDSNGLLMEEIYKKRISLGRNSVRIQRRKRNGHKNFLHWRECQSSSCAMLEIFFGNTLSRRTTESFLKRKRRRECYGSLFSSIGLDRSRRCLIRLTSRRLVNSRNYQSVLSRTRFPDDI